MLRKAGDKPKGLIATYVDDTLCAEDYNFLVHTDKTSQRFESKERGFDRTRFDSVYIEVHQSSNIERLKELIFRHLLKTFVLPELSIPGLLTQDQIYPLQQQPCSGYCRKAIKDLRRLLST